MLRRKVKKRRGQSTLEYCVIIAVVVAALVTMQIYVKRGIQGGLRQAADDIAKQYDPRNTNSDITTEVISDLTTVVETVQVDDKLQTTTTINVNDESTHVVGEENLGSLDASWWP